MIDLSDPKFLASLPVGKYCGPATFHAGGKMPDINDLQPVSIWFVCEPNRYVYSKTPNGYWCGKPTAYGVDWSEPCVYRLRQIDNFQNREVNDQGLTPNEIGSLFGSIKHLTGLMESVLARLSK